MTWFTESECPPCGAGCINDAKCLHYLLTNKLGFQAENIRMLTDDQVYRCQLGKCPCQA